MTEEAPLLVFQCRQCRTVLGDSLSMVSNDGDLRLVCLSAASSVYVADKEPRTSASAKDAGSTFFHVHCAGCQSVVGCVYRTTPRALDDLRDMVSLNADAITSYALGSHTVEVEGTRRAVYVRVPEGDGAEGDGQQREERDARREEEEGRRAEAREQHERLAGELQQSLKQQEQLVEELGSVREEIIALQHMVMLHEERFADGAVARPGNAYATANGGSAAARGHKKARRQV